MYKPLKSQLILPFAMIKEIALTTMDFAKHLQASPCQAWFNENNLIVSNS